MGIWQKQKIVWCQHPWGHALRHFCTIFGYFPVGKCPIIEARYLFPELMSIEKNRELHLAPEFRYIFDFTFNNFMGLLPVYREITELPKMRPLPAYV